MRAVYTSSTIEINEITIEGDQLHHLKNVVRARVGDELIILNGRGESALGEIKSISKKAAEINITKVLPLKEKTNFQIAIGLPKKDTFEDICRTMIEMGVSKIYAVHSDYSQWKFENSERLQKILISSLLQSNNLWLPEIIDVDSVDKLLALEKNIIYFDLKSSDKDSIERDDQILPLIGPEAGFSERERELLCQYPSLNLKTPILRTSTAAVVAISTIFQCTD